jgi:hypothetical protein
MTGHTLTVAVPAALYQQLQQRAAQMRRSIEDEVVLALAESVPSGADLPADLAATLASFAALDDDTLWRLARSRMPDDDLARLEDLADRRQRDGLNVEELREAEGLADRLDRVTLVRAEAAALLEERGHTVDPLLTGA